MHVDTDPHAEQLPGSPDNPDRRDFLKVIGSGALGAFIASLRPSFLRAASGRTQEVSGISRQEYKLERIPEGLRMRDRINVPDAKKLLVVIGLSDAHRSNPSEERAAPAERALKAVVDELKVDTVFVDSLSPDLSDRLEEARDEYRMTMQALRHYEAQKKYSISGSRDARLLDDKIRPRRKKILELERKYIRHIGLPVSQLFLRNAMQLRPCKEEVSENAEGETSWNNANAAAVFAEEFRRGESTKALVVSLSNGQWKQAMEDQNGKGAAMNAIFLEECPPKKS